MSYIVSRASQAVIGVVAKRFRVHQLDDGSSVGTMEPGRKLRFRPVGGQLQVGGLRHTGSQFSQPVSSPRVGGVPARGILPMSVALSQVNRAQENKWDEAKLTAELRKLSGHNRNFAIVSEDTGGPEPTRATVTKETLDKANKKADVEASFDEKYADDGLKSAGYGQFWCEPCQVEKGSKGVTGHIKSKGHQAAFADWKEAKEFDSA